MDIQYYTEIVVRPVSERRTREFSARGERRGCARLVRTCPRLPSV